jgi:chromosome segregation ATPase
VVAPRVFNQLVAPVQQNTDDINQLGSQLNDLQREQLDSRSAAEARLAEVEARLAASEARLHDAEDVIAEQRDLIQEMEKALKADEEQIAAFQEQLDTLQAELPGKAEYAEYNRQLLLMRAWQEILKARLRLMENNAGLALETLAEASALLDQAYRASSPEQQAVLDPIVQRLNAAIYNITANPFAATGDLEIAWHDLGLVLNPEVETTATDATPEATPEATPTP